ncbi:MAG TPA: hypothetical protein VLR70_04815, partial [Arthrobacter sp.]|nr:hypothetical protein [Arthrobacter sp.]
MTLPASASDPSALDATAPDASASDPSALAGAAPVGSMLVAAGTVIAPGAVHVPGWVDIRSGWIVACGAGEPPREPDHSFAHSTLAPGYVDVHAHGGG